MHHLVLVLSDDARIAERQKRTVFAASKIMHTHMMTLKIVLHLVVIDISHHHAHLVVMLLGQRDGHFSHHLLHATIEVSPVKHKQYLHFGCVLLIVIIWSGIIRTRESLFLLLFVPKKSNKE